MEHVNLVISSTGSAGGDVVFFVCEGVVNYLQSTILILFTVRQTFKHVITCNNLNIVTKQFRLSFISGSLSLEGELLRGFIIFCLYKLQFVTLLCVIVSEYTAKSVNKM